MAVYSRSGTEFTLNTSTTGEQFQPSVAGFAGGGFVVVWTTTDTTQDGSGRAIKFQLYDAAGLPVGGEILVNSATTLDQRAASVTVLDSGNFLVTWETTDTTQDGAGTAIKAQLFSGAGVAIGSEFLVNTNTTANQTNSTVTALADGGFVVAWQTSDSTQDGNASAIKAQRYDAGGLAVGGEFLVNPMWMGGETMPHLTALADGGFLATWTLGSGTSADIYAQRFDASGAEAGAEFRVNSVTAFNQDFATATQLADGRIVVTWASAASLETSDVDIKARVFSASGVPLGDEFTVSTTKTHPEYGFLVASTRPQIDELPDGGFVITWTHSAGMAIASSIRGQFYDANAERVGGEVVVSTATDRLEGNGDVAVDGLGTVFAVWASANSSASDNNIRGQFFTSESAPVITSNGGGDIAATSVVENTTAVTTVSASGGSGIVYTIAGGADAARFTIDAATGALVFAAAPDFEVRTDADGDGIYQVVVSASSGALSDLQQLAVTVTNVNEGLSFTGGASSYLYIENEAAAVATVTAVDADGDTVAYSLSGADAAQFTISAAGVLAFAASPDFEAAADADGDHIYEVTVLASDGSFVVSRALTVELLDQNEGPVITAHGGGDTAALTVSEGSEAVTFMTVADPDQTPSSYTYTLSGADAALFAIQDATGYLYFLGPRDFEAPSDANGDGVYEVAVTVSDGFAPSDTQALSITVGNANEGPVIVSNGGGASAAVVVDENTTAVTTVAASDPEGGVSYAIVGGADAALFEIDAATGALAFVAGPDHEAPADADGDNVYDVIVGASDGALTDSQTLAVSVTNLNDSAPVITPFQSDTIVSAMAENNPTYFDFGATDADGSTVVFSLSGQDAASLTVDASTGLVQFLTAPDFEAPGSAQGTNSYVFDLIASDGVFSDVLHVTLHVFNVNEPLAITSDGGGATAAVAVGENGTAVTTVVAADPDLTSPTYSITGGADAARFVIDASTGALSFVAAPDFEAPADADGDNVYQVTVSASDGTNSDAQTLSVTVGNVNEAPVISGGESASLLVDENVAEVVSVVANDPDSGIAYAIVGGADAARFTIDAATGTLAFVAAANHEMPTDADGDNVYEVVVGASDGSLSDAQTVSVTVGNVNEAPVIVSNGGDTAAALSVSENATVVTVVAASDPENAVSYALAGGADAARFTIDAVTGALSFVGAPDFEAPTDADGDNVYEVVVSASDGSVTDTQALSITVGNANEGPVIVSNGGGASAAVVVDENTTAVTTVAASDPEGGVSYAIVGGADAALFEIDAATGALAFVAGPDHEAPADADGDNVYDVIVGASDGALTDSQTLAVSVTNLNDSAPVITPFQSDTIVSAMAENNPTYFDFGATDADGSTVVFSLSGQDAASLTVDASTGLVQFLTAPDFEAPGSAQGTNSYVFDLIASDGVFSDVLHVTLHVFNVNEPLAITSDGGGATAAVAVGENGTAVTTVVAADPDLTSPTYSITGGADAARFVIDASTGALSFVAAPDFEAPADADGDNVYQVTVSASDGTNSDAQTLSVTVGNVNEAPVIVSNGGGTSAALDLAEGLTTVTTVAAVDLDGSTTFTYTVIGGADSALFAIDAGTGALSFITAPDYEAPADEAADNFYNVIVAASDGELSTFQAISVLIGNVNEAPLITSGGGGTAASYALNENATAVATIAANDAEGGVTYAIAGGADAARFAIDASTGALSFVAAPDFEAAGDADADNIYEVEVSASDGSLSDTQLLSVTVGNVNEAPLITSGGGSATASYALDENATAVATIAANDAEGSVTYAIAGGADAARFVIDATTGALSFVAAPDFDAAADADGDNLYDVVVSASDGSLADTQSLSVAVGNLVDGLVLTGTSQANTLNGSYEEDTISGLGGNDTLRGLAAADVLNGGDGADRLIGGTGADTLTGGTKGDIFEFETLSDSAGGASDWIADFTRSQGDKIELTDIDANTLVGGNQAFSFIGTAAFSNQAGQLRYFQQNGDTFVAGDVDGNGVADFQIFVDPLVSFIASDFIL